jgi:hypothetical protein
MNRVYLSFLGRGTRGKDQYEPTVYLLNGKQSGTTEFVQAAEMQILGAENFDRIIIVATQKSYNLHFDKLRNQLEGAGVKNVIPIIISEDMSPSGQWEWFEKILPCFEPGDELTVDLTHGYRAIPIVFSTAINFLQKAKNIRLRAVYYAAYEKNTTLAPIVDMKEFYIINQWAEAVSRLVEDADARKMTQLAATSADFQIGQLNDEDLIRVLEDLTNTVRNVDVNNVGRKADLAIRMVKDRQGTASGTEKILLDLVLGKFATLAGEPQTGRYDRPYFNLQLKIIELLLEHKLYMQAYTAMREFIASIGMIEMQMATMANREAQDRRQWYAETFFNMFQYPEGKWNFAERGKGSAEEKLRPYYEKLKEIGAENVLRSFVRELAEYRNGFDHAWTCKKQIFSDIEQKGKLFSEKLETVIRILVGKGILS